MNDNKISTINFKYLFLQFYFKKSHQLRGMWSEEAPRTYCVWRHTSQVRRVRIAQLTELVGGVCFDSLCTILDLQRKKDGTYLCVIMIWRRIPRRTFVGKQSAQVCAG